ncbi:HpcH/HpaI aldolase/citrate lyase family protein [Spiroplasma eriocheiris]|uniref:Citrate lyase subunit beta n=1 Tax=Spiroplasma eriocheiris TaxID=315358 RepID=A0A0H3XK28_9MOLU|nr:aldolase/citrate lyase family protein [Spiroplasma eriocheiris]AHF57771.1 citrate lyase beta subunit [Spiroplasma eriocheiris CCTCC M 207170]AKM54221.1 citrate lyase subunit beta [Spiroplasma eriocheiris]
MKKIRRNMLFVPGNNPGMFKDVIAFHPDTVMFDLEDSIHIHEKDAARQLTKRMLDFFAYNQYGIETAVRINGWDTEFYQEDLETIVRSNVNMIRLPKVETKDDVIKVVQDIEKIEQTIGRKEKITLFCAIESAKGVLNAYEIATASPRVEGIALGGVDYLFDLKAVKTKDRHELLFARQMIVHAARAAKVDAFDCIFGNTTDLVGLEQEALFVRELGFSGKSAIHPNQIEIINKVFSPSEKEIKNALKILTAYKEFTKEQKGVFAIDGQMIDKPFIDNAEIILQMANVKSPLED